MKIWFFCLFTKFNKRSTFLVRGRQQFHSDRINQGNDKKMLAVPKFTPRWTQWQKSGNFQQTSKQSHLGVCDFPNGLLIRCQLKIKETEFGENAKCHTHYWFSKKGRESFIVFVIFEVKNRKQIICCEKCVRSLSSFLLWWHRFF